MQPRLCFVGSEVPCLRGLLQVLVGRVVYAHYSAVVRHQDECKQRALEVKL